MALVAKNLLASEGDPRDVSLIPGLGRSPGEGNDNPLQYSCLEKSMDRGAWWATVHGAAKRQTQLSDRAHTYTYLLLVNKEEVLLSRSDMTSIFDQEDKMKRAR